MKWIEYTEFKKIIEAQTEARDLEFKSAFTWKKHSKIDDIQATVIKSIICISNLPYGGKIIIGVKQKDALFKLEGLNDQELESFKDYDMIKGQIDPMITPNTNFQIEYTTDTQGKHFVIIVISEFEDYPLITKKDLEVNNRKVIEQHTIYARSKTSPYSSIKAGYFETKEIIDYAVDKNRTLLHSRGWVQTKLNDKALFEKQKEDII